MKSYKLIKEYPGSPLLGKVITDTSMQFMTIQPTRYPEFWEEIPNVVAIRSVDGIDLCEGQTCWIFNSNCTVTNFIISKSYLASGSDRQVFSSREAAEKHLIDEIDIRLEDDIVKGENIPIYSLLPKANWDEKETTSLELWIRMKMGRNTANWKYFKSKDARDFFIKNRKPLFSMNDLMTVCRAEEVHPNIYAAIVARLIRMVH